MTKSTITYWNALSPEKCSCQTIRVTQRRAYGLRDEEYLQLKILTFILLRI